MKIGHCIALLGIVGYAHGSMTSTEFPTSEIPAAKYENHDTTVCSVEASYRLQVAFSSPLASSDGNLKEYKAFVNNSNVAVHPNDVAIFKCPSGYTLIGATRLKCTIGLGDQPKWNGSLPECRENVCPWMIAEDESAIQYRHGNQTLAQQYDGYPWGTWQIFSDSICNPGYVIQHFKPGQVECFNNGTWIGPGPTCVIDNRSAENSLVEKDSGPSSFCERNVELTNGSNKFERISNGIQLKESFVGAVCPDGYKLGKKPALVRTCHNGSWNVSKLPCISTGGKGQDAQRDGPGESSNCTGFIVWGFIMTLFCVAMMAVIIKPYHNRNSGVPRLDDRRSRFTLKWGTPRVGRRYCLPDLPTLNPTRTPTPHFGPNADSQSTYETIGEPPTLTDSSAYSQSTRDHLYSSPVYEEVSLKGCCNAEDDSHLNDNRESVEPISPYSLVVPKSQREIQVQSLDD